MLHFRRAVCVILLCTTALPAIGQERNRTMEEALKMHRQATEAVLDALNHDQRIHYLYEDEQHSCRKRLQSSWFKFRGSLRGHTMDGEHMLWMLLDSQKPVAANQVNMAYWSAYWTVDYLKKWKEALGDC